MMRGPTKTAAMPGRNRHALRLLVGLLALALLAAACGESENLPEELGGEPEAPADQPADDATEEATEEADGEVEEPEAAGEFAGTYLDGQVLRIIVPYNPGGSYDATARLLAPEIEARTGATVGVVNQPGAAGLLAINNLNNAQPDGLTIAVMNGPGTASAFLAEADGLHFDLGSLSYIGRMLADPRTMIVHTDSPYQDFEDVLEAEEFTFAVAGPGGGGWMDGAMLQAAFDLNARFVPGFASAADQELALLRQEVDGIWGGLGRQLAIAADGDARPLLIIDEERDPRIPDVPTITEYDMDSDARELVGAHVALTNLGQVLVGPPGVPEERLQVLRDLIGAIANDPDALAVAEDQGYDWAYRAPGDIQMDIESIMSAPDAYVEFLSAAE